jgi:hypothetical protein
MKLKIDTGIDKRTVFQELPNIQAGRCGWPPGLYFS